MVFKCLQRQIASKIRTAAGWKNTIYSGKISKFLDIDVFKYPQKQDLPSCFTYTGGFYIRKTELLNESKGFYLGEDIRGYLLPSEYEALDIDTEEDMLYFEFLIGKINEREQKLV